MATNMRELATTYSEIKEWARLEADNAELRKQLEVEVTRATVAEVEANAATTRANQASAAATDACNAAARQAEETAKALQAANEATAAAAAARDRFEGALLAQTNARVDAEARLAAAPGKSRKAPPPMEHPMPMPHKPIVIEYDIQRDGAGTLMKIIAREQP